MAANRRAGARRQGASRQTRGQGCSWQRLAHALWRGCKVMSVLAVLGVGVYFVAEAVRERLAKPVASVRIHGEFARVGREAVAERIYASLGSSFIKLDLRGIQQALRQEPWIDYARIERLWPDTIEVTVIEHKPIARWGKNAVLNHRGEIIELKPADEPAKILEGLPQLVGEAGREQQMMAQYQVISRLLKSQKLVISRLACDASGSWSMQLDNGVEIEIGRDDVINRLRRFMAVYDASLQQRWSQLQRIDLRYFNGLAVQWRDTANT